MTQPRAYRMSARARDMEETRQRILAAARQLFLDRSFPDVTLDDIAEGSGVTRQTVLNHFESKDGVFLAAAETVIGARYRDPSAHTDPLGSLLTEYEQVGDTLARLLDVESRFPAVHEFLEGGRRSHRDWVETTFASRLPTSGNARERTVLALVAATDVYMWKLLRRDLGNDADTVRSVIVSLVEGAVADGSTGWKEEPG